jgi:hypothetical protein
MAFDPNESRDKAGMWIKSVTVRGGTPADRQKVIAALNKIPQKAAVGSKLRQVSIESKTPVNPTMMAGDVIGQMDGSVMRLYPGFDEGTVHHEFGHSLDRETRMAHRRYLMQKGLTR